jgi:hypothetical protein
LIALVKRGYIILSILTNECDGLLSGKIYFL